MRKLSLYVILVLLCFNAKAAEKNYIYEDLPFDNYSYIFKEKDPTTFKKLIFIKKEKIGNVSKREKYSNTNNNKKKLFRSFSFIAEYEDNITVELFVEYNKDAKNFEKAEKVALYYSNMYGQMPHFLKKYNKKIYIHEDRSKDDGTWWVMYNKLEVSREFHINESRCKKNRITKYSGCATVMIHELAHVIQQLTGVISPSKWARARKLDNKKYCSKYAKKNTNEDFAESIVCWFVTRYKSNKITKGEVAKINQFIPNRLKLFDEMNFNMYPYKISK